MSIEQHTGPDTAPEPSGAALAHVLADLTRAVLDLPPAESQTQLEQQLDPEPDPLRARRPGTLLHELSFLDD
jgi:hypothetical protein